MQSVTMYMTNIAVTMPMAVSARAPDTATALMIHANT
jgi:hypothetical protein